LLRFCAGSPAPVTVYTLTEAIMYFILLLLKVCVSIFYLNTLADTCVCSLYKQIRLTFLLFNLLVNGCMIATSWLKYNGLSDYLLNQLAFWGYFNWDAFFKGFRKDFSRPDIFLMFIQCQKVLMRQ